MALTHSVVIITYRRPEYLGACLESLSRQLVLPRQVVVVDQSPNDESRLVTSRFAFATWVDNRINAGHMTTSRNVGLLHVDGDIVSFLDDDSLAQPDWSTAVLSHFHEAPEVGGVGGRVSSGQVGEAESLDPVGVITRSGRVVGNFGASRGRGIKVAHGVGANMSFRREALVTLGGFREDYPGTAMGEDTDINLRVAKLGYEILYASDAVVRHVSAPHIVGNRFDGRYAFYASSNYVLLARRNFGFFSCQFLGRVLAWREELTGPRSLKGKLFRLGCALAGSIYGLWLCLALDGVRKPPLILNSPRARQIRAFRPD